VAELKTKINDQSVDAFLKSIPNERRRRDAMIVLDMMKAVTRKPPKMWGASIVGFDQYHYKYASGHEGDMCVIGFSPRAAALTLYLAQEFKERDQLLARLGRHTSGKGCVYIKNLDEIDLPTLKALMAASYRFSKQKSS
jgi:hypothetical protein